MTVPIRIPKLGMSMKDGTLIAWYASDGDVVTEGTPLYSIASDKVESDVDAPASGRLRIVGEIDQDYDVGAEIGFIDPV